MNEQTRERLFGIGQAFEHSVTVAIVACVVVGLVASGGLIVQLRRRMSEETYHELFARWRSWCWLVGVIILPILAGAFWTMMAVMVLSLLCFREYARVTGLFREHAICAVNVLGILLVTFAALDHWEADRLFFALGSLTAALIVIVSIPLDRPEGFIQRVALGVLGFALFGFSLGYISNLANVGNLGNLAGVGEPAGQKIDYRPILLLLLVAVELNDIFAYTVGKSLGRRKLLPVTSPNKTLGGAVGALLLTTLLVYAVGQWLFRGTPIARPGWLLGLGVLISLLGQLGDLTLSSIKRDIGVKDVGATLPGHGGLLDRFDSLVLVPPAVYHYLSLALGDQGPLAANQQFHILTGSGGG